MITISTFNIQNNRKIVPSVKVDILLQYLKDYQVDLLGLQEVYPSLSKVLDKKLPKISFSHHGTYRFRLPFFYWVNERNPILTHYPVLSEKTVSLPFFPSPLKRILTKVEVKIEGKVVSIYNTHLDVFHESVKTKELMRILSILQKEKNPFILMGDFNLKTNKESFMDFIEALQGMSVQHVDVHEKTWKASQYHRAIDHIFLSKDFRLIQKKVILDIPMSDHYPVLAQVEFQK